MALKRYSHDQIKKMAARDEASPGWYYALCTKLERHEKEGEPIKFNVQFSPLLDPNDISSKHPRLSLFDSMTLGESDTSGDVEGFWVTMAADRALALFDGVTGELPDVPRFDKASKKWILDGEALGSQEAQDKLADVREIGLNAAIDAYEDDSDEAVNAIVGQKAVYVRVERTEGKKQNAGRFFSNIKEMRKELPEGASLVEPENFIYKVNGSDDAAPVKKVQPVTKAAQKKPAPKSARR